MDNEPYDDANLDEYTTLPNESAPKPPRKERRPRQEFIRGPLPLPWFAAAARLNGQALAVSMAIWFRCGIEGKTTFTLYPSAVKKFGVNRWSAYRALSALEEANLVSLERHRGRSPVVTILTCPDSAVPTPKEC